MRLTALAGFFIFTSLLPASCSAQHTQSPDASAIHALLDVIDTIMDSHPDYETERVRMAALSSEERAAVLAEKRARNQANEVLAERIDVLLSTYTYKLYFRKFRNATPEGHRRILLSLPYEAAPGPSDVSQNLMELCRHREEVRAWTDSTLTRLDPARSVARAAEWLPAGDYPTPGIRFLYDGNGDAFPAYDDIVFDVFSIVFRFRPEETRFGDLDGIGLERVEMVVAHEFHHVLARGLRDLPRASDERERREQRLATQMVSEGVALLCDLEPGMRRDAMEDSTTVNGWIDALNERLATSDSTAEDEWNAWVSASYGPLATDRLRDYLARRFPDGDLDSLTRAHAAARPMLVYTLGRHMIGRVLEGAGGKEAVLDLLREPQLVFKRYNAALGEGAAPGMGAAPGRRIETVYH
ncbi:MAG: hypothetical protein HKN20_07660 [Gemmatimonadetes bacterium]|nr:hypothetical protein [Gemmatimonadota bacterium]